MATPSQILQKHKPKAGEEPDNDDPKKKDDKKGGTKRNALIDFIAKCKKG